MADAIFQQAAAMAQQMTPENLALSFIFSSRRELQLVEVYNVLTAQLDQRDHQLGAARLNLSNAEQAQRNSENALGVANRDLAAVRRENDLVMRYGRQKTEECIRAETRKQIAEERFQEAEERAQEVENLLWDKNLEYIALEGQITAKDEQIAQLQKKFDQEQQAHQQTQEDLTRERHSADQIREQLAPDPEERKERVLGLAIPKGKRRRAKERYHATNKLQLALNKALLREARRSVIRTKIRTSSSVRSTSKAKTTFLKRGVNTPESQPQTMSTRASSSSTRSTVSPFRRSPAPYPKEF